MLVSKYLLLSYVLKGRLQLNLQLKPLKNGLQDFFNKFLEKKFSEDILGKINKKTFGLASFGHQGVGVGGRG